MATNAQWTVVFEDRKIIKNNGPENGTAYDIDDDSFWSNGSFSNIWAIQSGASSVSDEVEHRDATPHNSLVDEGINIQQFINKWDEAHLVKLQADWDADDRDESEKGARPTSYSS
tara:strand:- start:1765 stop:2109 length:345 start_codon:yes stop_codon:yes gene_type:complete